MKDKLIKWIKTILFKRINDFAIKILIQILFLKHQKCLFFIKSLNRFFTPNNKILNEFLILEFFIFGNRFYFI